MSELYIKNLDKEIKEKASFVLRTQGNDLTKAVRKMIDELADEVDKKK